LDNNRLEIVGAIDIAEEKVSKDLGDLLTLERRVGICVYSDWSKVLHDTGADVVLHATASRLKKVYPQIQDIVSAGMNYISSCEELFFPYTKHLERVRTANEKHAIT